MVCTRSTLQKSRCNNFLFSSFSWTSKYHYVASVETEWITGNIFQFANGRSNSLHFQIKIWDINFQTVSKSISKHTVDFRLDRWSSNKSFSSFNVTTCIWNSIRCVLHCCSCATTAFLWWHCNYCLNCRTPFAFWHFRFKGIRFAELTGNFWIGQAVCYFVYS